MLKSCRKECAVLCVTLLYVCFFVGSLSGPPTNTSGGSVVNFVHYIYAFSGKAYDGGKDAGDPGQDRQNPDYSTHPEEYNDIKEVFSDASDNPEVLQQEIEDIYFPSAETVRDPLLRGTSAETLKPKTVLKTQGSSRMLLSDNSFLKALSRLSWSDKLWLTKILSRCSLEEFIRIKNMLGDGVTWEENRAMFLILNSKITKEEQERLDSLIEMYTR